MKLNSLLFVGILAVYFTPSVRPQEKFNIATAINKFSLDLLARVNEEAGDNLNVALSPLTIWTLLTIVAEGAQDATARQLDQTLGLPVDKNNLRDSFQRFRTVMQRKTRDAEYETSNGIFYREDFPVKDKYAQIVKQYYDTSLMPVNFANNTEEAVAVINKYVAQATRNRIPTLVYSGDVQNAYLFITSTLYFKGVWETPFNKTSTKKAAFFDDKKTKIGDVQMMYQVHPFPYFRMDKIKADAIELPYGFDDAFSMLVLVPRGPQTLTNMLNAFTKESVTDLLSQLKANNERFSDEVVHVYLPKFKVTSDFNMNKILIKMGIQDVMDPAKANLLGIFNHYLYLSKIIQKAEIEVDEDGTVASAAGGAVAVNRITPLVVNVSRPFAYFIIHKQTGSVIFAGKISNPNTLG